MLDLDLMYVTYRQQELWHEAAARALTAQVYPARPRWRTGCWTPSRPCSLTCSGGPRGARTHARCLPWCAYRPDMKGACMVMPGDDHDKPISNTTSSTPQGRCWSILGPLVWTVPSHRTGGGGDRDPVRGASDCGQAQRRRAPSGGPALWHLRAFPPLCSSTRGRCERRWSARCQACPYGACGRGPAPDYSAWSGAPRGGGSP